ncbi:MAG: VTT domain-containing protein [Chromatiales bacterium]
MKQQVNNSGEMLQPGHNCWRIQNAERATVIIDTADYFKAFAEACRNARHQILILGWDFDRREQLHRDKSGDAADELGAFLVDLVKQRKQLNVYLLSWDFNMIYAAERELLPALRLRLQTPPRFHFRLDGKHPKGASHHQKVVVIDDRIAFVGGIDLSRWRWDTPEHKPDDPRRLDPNGKPYAPFHDMMMLVEGEVAASLGELVRRRWRRSRGWRIPRLAKRKDSPWPQSVSAGIADHPVAIARTEPLYGRRRAVDEVKQLYLDAITAAERFIYIENQYFTATSLADAISERLAEPEGPEVILVLPKQTGGWLEQVTMDVLRGRVVSKMQQADKHHRLRIWYPHQPGLGDFCISVHAKLLIVDDRLIRVGSSNTSSRSMGLDTECDLALEAGHDDGAAVEFIQDVRHRLLTEHLDCDRQQLIQAETEQPGLIAAIEQLQTNQRSLRPLNCSVPEEVDDMVPDTGLIDPAEPFSADYFVSEYVPKSGRSVGRKRLLLFVLVIAALFALAAAWRWTPLQEWLSPERLQTVLDSFSSPAVQAAVAISGVTLASLLMVPLTLLAVVAGIAFAGWQAFAYVLAGSLVSSMIAFGAGRVLGQNLIKRGDSGRLQNLSQRIAKRGTVAVAILRMVPIAPFTVFNLVSGASHLGARQFLFGSLLGLAPGLGAVTLFSSSLWQAVTEPTATTVVMAVGVGFVLVLLAWMAKRWLRSA